MNAAAGVLHGDGGPTGAKLWRGAEQRVITLGMLGPGSRVSPMLSVESLPASLRVYAGLLGGEESFRFPPEGPATVVRLRFGQTELGLRQVDGASPPQPPAPGRGVELCVQVSALDRVLSELARAGLPIVTEAREQPWGERVACARDPDGNRIWLVEQREGPPA